MVIPAGGIVRSSSAQNKFLMIDTIGKELYYGDGGAGTTPTWQQTLDATNGNVLTKADTIEMGVHDLFFNASSAQVNFASDDPGSVTVHFHVFGETDERLQIQADGHLEWGDGTGNIDIGMTRTAPSTLLIGGFGGNTTNVYLDAEGATPTDSVVLSFTHDNIIRDGSIYFDNVNGILGINPYSHKFNIVNLTNLSTQNRLLGQFGTGGQIGYVTLAGSLSLSSGVLTGTGITGLTVGTTAIASGTTTRILYDNAGVLGEYTITGSGTVVAMQTSPSFVTSVIGGASFDVFNTTSTTINAFGAATSMTIGGTPTTAITHNYSTNATATATTKTINFGTGGAAGSTTNINIGSSNGGTLTINEPTTISNQVFYGNANSYNDQTGTTYTLVAGDNGKIVTVSNASAITVTVPASLPTGFNCTVVQKGAGQITFAASSTTLNNRQSFTKTAGQYAAVAVIMYASNTFILQGDMQ